MYNFCICCFFKKEDSSLEDYSLDRYSEVYTHDANYENNILIEIIAYDNFKEIDYMPIVGDNVRRDIDIYSENKSSLFGHTLSSSLDNSVYKVTDIYKCINSGLMEFNEYISLYDFIEKYESNKFDSKILNRTSFKIDGE